MLYAVKIFLDGLFNFCGIFRPHPGPAPAGISPGPVQIGRRQAAAGRKPEPRTGHTRKPTGRKGTGPGYTLPDQEDRPQASPQSAAGRKGFTINLE